MTGNELAQPDPRYDPLRPENIIGSWLRDKGKECFDLKVQVECLAGEIVRLKEARTKQVVFMQQLADLLGLPYPAPEKILAQVTSLVNGRRQCAGSPDIAINTI